MTKNWQDRGRGKVQGQTVPNFTTRDRIRTSNSNGYSESVERRDATCRQMEVHGGQKHRKLCGSWPGTTVQCCESNNMQVPLSWTISTPEYQPVQTDECICHAIWLLQTENQMCGGIKNRPKATGVHSQKTKEYAVAFHHGLNNWTETQLPVAQSWRSTIKFCDTRKLTWVCIVRTASIANG